MWVSSISDWAVMGEVKSWLGLRPFEGKGTTKQVSCGEFSESGPWPDGSWVQGASLPSSEEEELTINECGSFCAWTAGEACILSLKLVPWGQNPSTLVLGCGKDSSSCVWSERDTVSTWGFMKAEGCGESHLVKTWTWGLYDIPTWNFSDVSKKPLRACWALVTIMNSVLNVSKIIFLFVSSICSIFLQNMSYVIFLFLAYIR